MKNIENKRGGVFASLCISLLLSQVTFAQNNQLVENNSSLDWSMGVGLNMTTFKDAKCEDITYGVTVRLGYDVNQYVGIEGRLTKTNWEYEGAKVEHMGFFAKPMLPINENLHFYGLLGFGKTTTGNKKVFSDTGFAWGLGINYYFNDEEEERENHQGLGLFLDYENLLQKSNTPTFDSLNVGLMYRF